MFYLRLPLCIEIVGYEQGQEPAIGAFGICSQTYHYYSF